MTSRHYRVDDPRYLMSAGEYFPPGWKRWHVPGYFEQSDWDDFVESLPVGEFAVENFAVISGLVRADVVLSPLALEVAISWR